MGWRGGNPYFTPTKSRKLKEGGGDCQHKASAEAKCELACFHLLFLFYDVTSFLAGRELVAPSSISVANAVVTYYTFVKF